VGILLWPVIIHRDEEKAKSKAIYQEAEEGGYIGYVAELPGANTQGETLEEVRENLSEQFS